MIVANMFVQLLTSTVSVTLLRVDLLPSLICIKISESHRKLKGHIFLSDTLSYVVICFKSCHSRKRSGDQKSIGFIFSLLRYLKLEYLNHIIL